MRLKLKWYGNVCRERVYVLDEYVIVGVWDDLNKENRVCLDVCTTRDEGYRGPIRQFGAWKRGFEKVEISHTATFAEEEEYNKFCAFLDEWEHAERVM